MSIQIITIAIIAWAIQFYLGWYQLKSFNRMFEKLCQQGKVGLGRSTLHRFSFKPRVIIALAVDENKRVISAIIMKGLSIFARPQPLSSICGYYIQDIDPEKVFPHRKTCQEALSSALYIKD